ncbi:prepilin-type N-terminal cleavage/methylation domain-containing protein [Vulgatibacter sp.]|uniref:type IV pilus modification PilV family protein n=1 Tax=Vulgatibacter sp. TaxID=1971226 RepID=UPI00356B2EA3
MRKARGFTLLEVMVAVGILALAITAIVGINGNAINAHQYSKRVTVATMLARSKMVDLESQFNEEGFTSQFDQKMAGDFSEEGWDEFRWEAEIVKPELDEGSATSMVQNLVQQFTGQAEDEVEAASNTAGGPTPALPGGMGAMAAQFAPMIESQVSTLTTTLEQSVREVRLKVSWGKGEQTESVDVTTHFVILPQAQWAPPK